MEGIRSMNLFSWLEPFVLRLLEGSGMPLCVGKITVKDFQNSGLIHGAAVVNDTFTVCIPYAGSTLQWKVIFDGHTPEGIPDFLFSDPSAFDPDYEDVPSLVEWKFSEPSSLCHVIKDLIGKYKQHQLHLLADVDEKISRELLEVINNNNEFPNVDTSVLTEGASQNGNPQYAVNILIQVKLNFSEIPEICFKDSPPEDPHFLYPVLLLRISSSNNKVVPLLYLSPRLEHALGGRNSMKLPQYYYQSTTVSKYCSTVLGNINSVFAVLRDSHSKRREYMAAFLFQCASSILEYDAQEFFKISLLFTFEDFYFIVHVTLGRFFPQEQPKIILQSVYHASKRGALYQVTYSSYPYSPRWSGAEMVKRARTYIISQISGFKAECLNDGKI